MKVGKKKLWQTYILQIYHLESIVSVLNLVTLSLKMRHLFPTERSLLTYLNFYLTVPLKGQ
jgi:hypothetical protein